MPRIAQSIRRLFKNRIAGNEPEHHRALGLKQFRHRQAARVTRQECFAAAGGNTETNIRHFRFEPACRDRNVRDNLTTVFLQHPLKRPAGATLPGASL